MQEQLPRTSKEKYLACRSENRLQNRLRVAFPYYPHQFESHPFKPRRKLSNATRSLFLSLSLQSFLHGSSQHLLHPVQQFQGLPGTQIVGIQFLQ